MSRFLAVTTSRTFERRLTASLGRGHELRVLDPALVAANPAGFLLQNHQGPVNVLVIGPDVNPEQMLAVAAGVDRTSPGVVVVVAAVLTTELTLAAMQCGVRDVMAPDAEPAQMRQVLERNALTSSTRFEAVSRDAEDQRHRGRIISVMSPKGGVGKTTVATNLAVGLAKTAPRGAVIVDLDLQFGDVASGLNLEPQHTISEAVTGAAPNDPMVLKAFLSRHESGAYVLCAPHRPADADLIKPVHVTTLINQLSLEFPYVILDTSPGLGDVVLAILELATDGIWVCGMDVPSIRGLNHGLEVLRQLDLVPAANTIVLNFADKRSGLTVQDVEATIGRPVDIVLPRSRTVPFSTNSGIPLLQNGSRDPAGKGLKKLLERCTRNPEPTSPNTPQRSETP
jgi:pilus assembly protein CpaE